MKKLLLPLLILFFITNSFADESRERVRQRIDESGAVLDEIMSAPDRGIPEEVIGSAECVAIVPSMLKGGFVFGAEYGRGVATCRNANGWSAPAFFRVGGGSFGLQIGGQAVDLVMLVMNQRGMQALLSSHFKLGADASAAAGPVGRHAEGMTDWKMRAEVLTYSRARGLFAGITLNGAVVSQDKGDTSAFYGRMIPFKRILTGGVEVPKDAEPFLSAVNKYNHAGVEAKSAPANAPAPAAAAASTAAHETATQPAADQAANQAKPDPTKPADAAQDPH
ncbi:MAG TPA: lipid-binding SYLF domain-containing protein [Terriglobales bacterium]|nr:lipid-binding SYLF domain-containing protein [Terriglobales bacterium]